MQVLKMLLSLYRRRDEIMDKIRQLETDSGVSDSEPEDMDFVEISKNRKFAKSSDKTGDSTSKPPNSEIDADQLPTSSRVRGGRGRNAHQQQRYSQVSMIILNNYSRRQVYNFFAFVFIF